MVVPHQVGDLVRSFVRVPGSGSDLSAKPTFCDLGRLSTLAATVSVPQNLLPPTNVLTLSPSSIQNQERKRLRTKDLAPQNQEQKRPRILAPKTKHWPSHQPNDVSLKIIPCAEVQKLKEENKALKEENQKLMEEVKQLRNYLKILEKQNSLLGQLILNPQRLNSVMRRLEVMKASKYNGETKFPIRRVDSQPTKA